MKRSGSKLIAKAGSVKNISKAGYRFAFELSLESCDNMLGNSDVVCTWERGPKVLSTDPFKVSKPKRVVNFDGATMRQEVTMFKKKKSDADFEPKVYRLALRQGSSTGKVVGKIDLNFADYAEVPSYSKRIGAPLSSGSRLVLRVNSNYIGEVDKKAARKGRKGGSTAGDDDASSMFSDSTLGGSGNDKYSVAAAEELAERERDMQDLDDLAIDGGYDQPTSSSVSSRSERSHGGGSGARSRDPSSNRDGGRGPPAAKAPSRVRERAAEANSRVGDSGARARDTRDAADARDYERGPAASKASSRDTGAGSYSNPPREPPRYGAASSVAARSREFERSRDVGDDYGPSSTSRYGGGGGGYGGGGGGGGGGRNYDTGGRNYDTVGGDVSRAELDRIRAENKQLRRANDQLKERLAESSGGGYGASDEEVRQLQQENSNLKRDVEELEERLAREPVYADVVRELRESKMALAILTMERDELQQKVRSAPGGGNGIASRNML